MAWEKAAFSTLPENNEAAGKSDKAELRGVALIAALLKNLPNKPGVYRMLNTKGDVLYVGKARNLRKRVANYTRPEKNTARIARMIHLTANMEFIVTRSETEALLLEANLIKHLAPRFNVLLRDDKSFPYIFIGGNIWAPGLFKHRGARTKKGEYFGPFAAAGAVNRTISSLQRAFLLRSCTDNVFELRTRPCLLYQIKRCSAPCTGLISRQDYLNLTDQAKKFLSGKSNAVKDNIAHVMMQASDAMDFEQAAAYRDRLAALAQVQAYQGIHLQHTEEADVFALYQKGGLTSVQVFFFRSGQNWGNHAYFPAAAADMAAGEILTAFLMQFYNNKPIPRLILLSHAAEDHNVLEAALSLKNNRKTYIIVPQRGEKKELVTYAEANAREALERKLAQTASQTRLLQAFATIFNLNSVPQRIEVYDNSHIMGTNAVGAMIVAGKDGFIKNQYRKFNIRSTTLTPGDDYAMMREVMERRFSRLIKEQKLPPAEHAKAEQAEHAKTEEDKEDFPAWPDILLIDGGSGQTKIVRQVLEELQIAHLVTIIGIAKGVDRNAGRERFFMKGRPEFSLPPRDPVLYFIQRLRDEAHRFAIGSHRIRRKKDMIKSPLDDIEGIGAARKRALLKHFGTARAVARAAIEDLLQVKGISQSVAQTVYAYFNE
ncbi:excinuclease ABC subunit UvrC [Candidatus Tokpelaia sp.]|uniref:excinuclease ABC subunit UvrC n=1 Tax=Candidatus Tokpelaia sp. TaxID=2233777 RepID=UPI00123865B3|nr:excinuclease ABC subunit UvrC [Candidatus Tokpelaia sp.]KAA6405009.1 excinuclease ABC subunit C [Candidatus Tokpelaia sp.]